MSSIAGQISFTSEKEPIETIRKMCEAMNHASAFRYCKGNQAHLGCDEEILFMKEKQVYAVLDGEIFNKEELFELIGKECSDCELIVQLYLQYQQECISKLNGVFSFVIIDEKNQCALLARDPMGVKPLFYTLNQKQLIFASEIKAILKHPSVKACAGQEELMELLFLGPGRTPGKTYFKDIEEIKPGHYLLVSSNDVICTRYDSLPDIKWEKSEEETIQLVHDLLSDAVDRQCKGKDHLCAMLSGGLDSSVVTALASEYGCENVYSVDYEGQKEHFKPSFYQPGRDQDYIDLMVKRYKLNDHQIVLSSNDLMNSLKEALTARDMPSMADVDGSLLCFLKRMKQMNEQVVLSGECSDEIFGGYPWFVHDHLRTFDHFPWSNQLEIRKKLLKKEFQNVPIEVYVQKKIEATLCQLSFRKGITEEEKQMKQMMKLNLDWFMQTLLERADRMARAAQMKVLVPFCDLQLVKTLYQIPWSMKYAEGVEKSLLRRAFESVLPEEICYRKKSPYPKTHHPEYEQAVYDELMKILNDKSNPIHEICETEELLTWMNCTMETPWYGQLMTRPQMMAYFIQINEWLKMYDVEIIHPKG